MIPKIFGTIAVLALWSFTSDAIAVSSPLLQNQVAGGQLNGGDLGYIQYVVAHVGLKTAQMVVHFIAGLFVFAIWARSGGRAINWFVKQLAEDARKPMVALALGLLAFPHDAHAYRATTDYTEILFAKPSWTIYLIPLFGDNSKTQAKLEGEEFYKQNKVSAKNVIIPHAKLAGTGWTTNDVVTSAIAIAVDHMPHARAFSAHSKRGTSTRDEGIHCETQNGHDITAGIAISVVIREEDGAKYLYHFNADMNHPLATSQSEGDAGKDKTFVSAVAATSLPDVMDTFGFRVIQTALCKEYASKSTNDAILMKADILEKSRIEIVTLLGNMGITVLTYGFAEPQTFEPAIQNAIDNVYIAEKRALAAASIATALPIMERQARVELMLGLAKAAENGKLPALPSIIGGVPSELMDPLKSWLAEKK